jgi:thioredoxin-like negative regulator of GroEL
MTRTAPPEQSAPDAELLIAPGCPHCGAVLEALAGLVKESRIGRLVTTNLAHHPEIAADYGVRSVPWTRIGPFDLPGRHTAAELRDWTDRAADPDRFAEALGALLADGALDAATAACRREPRLLPALVSLAGDLDTPYAVRVGVGAVLEDLAGSDLLIAGEAALLALSAHAHAPVRADAAHYLGLLDSPASRARLAELAADEDAEVREIADESLSGR